MSETAYEPYTMEIVLDDRAEKNIILSTLYFKA